MPAFELWAEDSNTIVYCAFCPDWKIEGTAREVRDIAREHRLTVHPDLPPPTRRRRANLGAWRARLNEAEVELVATERTRRMRLLGIESED